MKTSPHRIENQGSAHHSTANAAAMKTRYDHTARNPLTAARGRRRSHLRRGSFAACCALLLAGGTLPPSADAVTITFKAAATSDLTLNTNYSTNTLPDNTTDLRLASTITALALSGANLTAQSLDISTANITSAYSIQNTTTGAGNSTITLGNSISQNNTFTPSASASAGVNDLIYLNTGTSGVLSLTIQGANTSGGTGTLGLVLANNGNFDTTANTTLNISAAISGAFTATKVGVGTLNLSGNNTFTGFTASNGTTNLGANGTLGGVNTFTVGVVGTSSSFGTVRLSTTALDAGTSFTNVINDTAAVVINANSSVGGLLNLAGGTETIGSLTANSGLAKLVIGDYTNASNTVLSGGLTVGDANSTTFAGVISGTHTGATAALTKVGTGTLTLSGANTFTGGVALNGGLLALGSIESAGASGPLGLSGTISFGGGTLQYLTGNTTDYSARFSNAANQAYSIDTNNLQITFASNLTSQGGSLTKLGANNLILSGANTFTGPVNLNAGGLRASSAENPGVSGPFGVGGIINFNGGSLQYSSVNTFDYSSRFSTAANQLYTVNTNSQNVTWASDLTSSGGTLSKLGAGTLTLGGNNTYSGTTTLSAGTLALVSAENPGVSGPMGAGGSVLFNGGTLQYSATNNYDYSSRLTVAAGQNYNIDTNSQVVNFGSALAGTGGLNKISPGTLTLSGPNTFTGGVTIGAGIVIAGGPENAGVSGPLGASGTITFDGGNLQYSTSNNYDYSSRFSTAINQAFRINTANQSVSFASPLASVGGTLVKLGNGTLILAGANTYTGNTTLSAGILRVSSAETVGTSGPLGVGGNILFNGGTLQYSAANNFDYSSRFSTGANQSYIINTNGQDVTLASNLTSTGGLLTKQSGGTLTLSGANTYTGTTTLSAGTLRLNSAETAGTSGPLGVGGTISFNGGTLLYSTNNNFDYSSRFSNADNQAYNISTGTVNVAFASNLTSTGGSLNKLGSGMLTLSGANTYSGGTTVTTGTLQISNGAGTSATGSGAVTVNSGTTLQGRGYIDAGGNLITINGTLSPGSNATPVGTIHLSSTAPTALTLASTSTLAFDITNAATKDLVALNNSSLALNGGTLALNLGAGFDYMGTYALFMDVSNLTMAMPGSPFATVSGYDSTNYSAVFTLNGTEFDLTFTPTNVPEPSTLAGCAALLAGAAGWRSRGRARAWLTRRAA